MVTTEPAQLLKECNAWRETLRTYRDEFNRLKHHLQQQAGKHTHKEELLQIEHIDNQLHIQLINIHDLKHSIKNHERKLENEMQQTGRILEETAAQHESFFDEYQRLDHTLQEIRAEYVDFQRG